ncbi:hypothetical protein D9611_014501 [Ephemerocybe angulata]|uniref:Uncharacterized protein n=1 Tax=Ephemerocybe angulata TaxID=980116 RepID=A0A8H5C3Z6_9AGAR|nr:hypothetical protein D9611_014501 [Tulosesus angulatus]
MPDQPSTPPNADDSLALHQAESSSAQKRRGLSPPPNNRNAAPVPPKTPQRHKASSHNRYQSLAPMDEDFEGREEGNVQKQLEDAQQDEDSDVDEDLDVAPTKGIAPLLVNPIPASGVLPMLVILPHILTELWSVASKDFLKKATTASYAFLVWLASDTKGSNIERKTEVVLDIFARAMGVPEVLLRVVTYALKVPKRGAPDLKSITFWFAIDLDAEEYASVASRNIWSTEAGTVFTLPLPLAPTTFVALLTGEDFKPPLGEKTTARLGKEIREDLKKNDQVRRAIEECHTLGNTVAPHITNVETLINNILNTVRVVGRARRTAPGEPPSRVGQYGLHINSPTNNPELYLKWLAAVRRAVITTVNYGTAYANYAGHCTVCHGMDHTEPYCECPALPAWHKQVDLVGANAARGSRGRGDRRFGGRGGRGRAPR